MSKIQWTDRVWNPITGCTKVSAGCKNCYAERIADRKLPGGGFTDRAFTDVRCHPERLDAPLHWRKPRRVFVNSMSDLFHKDVRYEFMAAVFGVMAACPRHTFQVLTKRADEMLGFFDWVSTRRDGVSDVREYHRPLDVCWAEAVKHTGRLDVRDFDVWPLPNVWLGVSVEDQRTADERIPLLLQTPAVVRFVSYEPALGPIKLRAPEVGAWPENPPVSALANPDEWDDWKYWAARDRGIGWVIVGGESGPGARPCDVAWIRSAVEQCKTAGVPVFVKQLGAAPLCGDYDRECHEAGTLFKQRETGQWLMHLNDRKGGNPDEWPADLRVREFPGGSR